MTASFNTSFSDINLGLFGEDSSTTTSGTKVGTEATDKYGTSRLAIDEEGILKTINDILTGTSGLSEIFSAELAAGLDSSSVAKYDTSTLMGQIAGSLAQLTGTTVETASAINEIDMTETGTSTAESQGLLDDPVSTLSFGLL